MYRYSDFDDAFVRNRVAQFSGQVARRLSGALTEEEFRPLRLMNGLYLQLHAYMLRVAIPYGTISARQMRQLAHIAATYDKGYGHFTTRQNIQFNWPKLPDVPAILSDLADVQMHAIQTSGNCIRNVTADHFAGAALEEVADPRPVAELLRQWSTDHPEFQFLPRKFKIAVTGSEQDRAVIRAHDVGLQIVRDASGAVGYRVFVGGGLGRTPMLGQEINPFVPQGELLPYLEAIVAAWNIFGRRDNKFKARIKITLLEHGLEAFRALVEQEFARTKPAFKGVDEALFKQIEAAFAAPEFTAKDAAPYAAALTVDPALAAWAAHALSAHKRDDHAIVTVSIKAHGETPGDASAEQMRALADIAETYGYAELRISHEQNVILPHVAKADLPAVFTALAKVGLASTNQGLISDIIACPGMDYCALATARAIPVAQDLARHFKALGIEDEIGRMQIKISGCINACGHHHVGHIGILGLDRAGVENYQITLGGDATEHAAIGERMGPGFAYEEVTPAIERMVRAYLAHRSSPAETFIQAVKRLGPAPFKAALYPEAAHAA